MTGRHYAVGSIPGQLPFFVFVVLVCLLFDFSLGDRINHGSGGFGFTKLFILLKKAAYVSRLV